MPMESLNPSRTSWPVLWTRTCIAARSSDPARVLTSIRSQLLQSLAWPADASRPAQATMNCSLGTPTPTRRKPAVTARLRASVVQFLSSFRLPLVSPVLGPHLSLPVELSTVDSRAALLPAERKRLAPALSRQPRSTLPLVFEGVQLLMCNGGSACPSSMLVERVAQGQALKGKTRTF